MIKKGGELLKKDLFNENIKREYVSYIWATIITVALVFFWLRRFVFIYFFVWKYR